MRVHQALPRKSDGRFDYTVSYGDGAARPQGYCAGYIDPDELEADLRRLMQFPGYCISEAEKEAVRRTKDKYHADGHATAEEAVACFQQYELDHRTRYYPPTPEREAEATEQHRCQVCQAWTVGSAIVGQSRHLYLCPEHCNRESVEKLLKPAGDVQILES